MVAGFNSQQTQTAAAIPPTPVPSLTPLASPSPLATFAISTGSFPFGTPFTLATAGTPGTPRATLPSGTGAFSYPVGCNNATYIGDTGPADKAVIAGGKVFDVGFSMLNSGTCTWDEGYAFSFLNGDKLSANKLSIVIAKDKSEFTAPNHSQSFVITFQAPKAAGVYRSNWQMQDDKGTRFGSIVYVWITVLGPGQVTETPTKKP
jgi:hypothetical protein